MKIRTLEIFNIASIENATIHFDQSPLSEADVYLITGETGSGKTTILDAICLALYATTPRLFNAERNKVEDNDDNLTKDNPCRLMRRNTGEAYVKLTFEGIDGNEYLAEWQVQRGKFKKPSSDLSDPTWSVTNLTTGGQPIQAKGRIESKLKDVREAIEQAVGLKFDEFCRTTMLAQGEFTKFLKSSDDEKAKILEKITNLTQFREIGKRIYNTIEQKKLARNEATDKAADTGLTTAEVDSLKALVAELEADIRRLSTAKADLDARKSWLTAWHDLSNVATKAEADLREAQLRVESDEHKAKQQTIADHDATHDVRNWLKALNQNLSEAATYTQQLSALKSDYTALLEGIRHEIETLTQKQAQASTLGAYIEANQPKAEIFAQAGTLATQLKQIARWRLSIAEDEKSKQLKQQSRDEVLAPTLSVRQQQLDQAQQAYLLARQQVEAKQKELDAKGLPSLRNDEKEANALMGNIELAERSLEALQKARKDRNDEEARLAKQLSDIDHQTKQLTALAAPLAKAEGEMEGKKQAMDKLGLTVNQWTKELRSKVKTGDTCPVCGQTVHTELVQEVFESLYQTAEKDYKEAEAAHRELKDRHDQLSNEIKAKDRVYREAKAQHDKDQTVPMALTKLAADCRKCGIMNVDGNVEAQLAQLKAATEQRRMELAVKIEAAEKLDSELKQQRAACDGQLMHINKELTPLRDRSKSELEACERQIGIITTSIDTTRNNLTSTEAEVEKILPRTVWDGSPETFGLQLVAEAKTYHDNLSRKQSLDDEVKQLKGIVDDAQKECHDIIAMMSDWQAIEATEAHPMKDVKAAANRLQDVVSQSHTLLRNARKEATQNQQLVDDFLTQHAGYTPERLNQLCGYTDTVIAHWRQQVQAELSDTQTKQELLNKAQRDKTEHQAKRPATLLDADTVTDLAVQVTELERTIGLQQQQLGGKNKELADDVAKKQKLAALIAQKEEAEREYNAWNSLKDLADKEGRQFARIAMTFIFDGLLNSANVYLKRLSPRYQLKSVKNTLYMSLEDAYQGFATRGTDSLSGGESFLVSLALALALADVGQQLSVDNLFIDEGFGSLSGAPLTHAINTLRSLHSHSGRHVGIISHIDEVKNNIPIQIQVQQSGGSSSSTIEIVG